MKAGKTLTLDRLNQFHDLSLRVISDYYREVMSHLVDFSRVDFISIVVRGAQSYFRFSHFEQTGWEMTQLDSFPEEKPVKASSDCSPDLLPDHYTINKLESLVFSGSALKVPEATDGGGIYIHLSNPADGLGCYRTLLVLPVKGQEENVGTVVLAWRKKANLENEEIRLYHYIFNIIGLTRTHRQAKFLLNERIKELKTIYQINRVGSVPGKSLDDIMMEAADVIPTGFLRPEHTSCKIVYANRTFKSTDYKKPNYTLKEDIVVDDKARGYVEVGYTRKAGSIYKDPFLKEEQPMLKALAGELGHIAARKQYEVEKERLQQQLLHADRLVTVGQLTAGIAHELNEPLGGILGFAQLIKKYGQIDENVEKDIDKIIKASLHGREIIRKLMLFSRQSPPEKVMINLNERIDDGLYLLENRIKKSSIRLAKDYAAELPLIEIDPAQLNQVLVNLVVNAIQAMPRGGKLTIKTYATIDELSIMIKDTGTGIDPGELENIFIPFYTTKGPSEGAGLGLPVALGIVQSHGGSIVVESEPGKGSVFKVTFPLRGGNNNGEEKQK